MLKVLRIKWVDNLPFFIIKDLFSSYNIKGDHMYIGIIGRINENKVTYNKEIVKVITDYGFIPLGIIVNFENNPQKEFNIIKPLIDMCSGFILQGGDKCYDIDILITKYLYDKNIPTLGICLGMQTMALAFNGVEGYIGLSHKSNDKYVHNIIINKNTKLIKIIDKKEIMVNSRHKDYIISTDLTVSAHNEIIEAIEDSNKNFFYWSAVASGIFNG